MKVVGPVVAMLMALLVGCRSHTTQELLERDLRQQEDALYQLQCKLDQQCALVDALSQENATLRSGAYPAPATTPTTVPTTRPPRSIRNGDTSPLAPPTIELPGEQAAPFRAPPEIKPFDPNVPEGEVPPSASAPTPPIIVTPTAEMTIETSNDTAAEVAVISLNPRVTGGYASDDKPGDDGVTVLVEPRTADGKLVERPGALTIVVMDPAVAGVKGRIARWDFSEQDIVSRWRSSPDGKGWRFDLHWPSAPPVHGDLIVHTRYTTASGAKLDAQAPIKVDVPGVAPTVDRKQAVPTSRQWTRSTRPMPLPIGRPAVPMAPLAPATDPSSIGTAARGWSPYR
ncbi:MAG TPA: hypothetical protein VHV77_00495 [Pirellulales bacterium]|nr:hypothetical protein [Pirellulales bacterium]